MPPGQPAPPASSDTRPKSARSLAKTLGSDGSNDPVNGRSGGLTENAVDHELSEMPGQSSGNRSASKKEAELHVGFDG